MDKQNPGTFEQEFSLGPGYDEAQAAEPTALRTPPASRTKSVKDAAGKDRTVFLDIFGYKLAGPGKPGKSYFGDPILTFALAPLKRVDGERGWLYYEVPTFHTATEIRRQILARIETQRAEAYETGSAFSEPTDTQIEEQIAARVRGRDFAKGTFVSFMEAVSPMTLDDLLGPEAEGVLVGVGRGIRKFTNKDGEEESRGTVRKFFPIGAITDGSTESGTGN